MRGPFDIGIRQEEREALQVGRMALSSLTRGLLRFRDMRKPGSPEQWGCIEREQQVGVSSSEAGWLWGVLEPESPLRKGSKGQPGGRVQSRFDGGD